MNVEKPQYYRLFFVLTLFNDKEYDGKHLENIHNLYSTSDSKSPLITGTIEMSKADLVRIIDEHNNDESPVAKKNISFSSFKNHFTGEIDIQRNLRTNKYAITDTNLSVLNPLISKILSKSPYILYNDDFVDRPPNSIEVPNEKPEKLSNWLAIFERLFKSTDSSYSLFKLIKEDDERRRASIISDVDEHLNTKLSKAWKTFSLSSHSSLFIKFNLNITTDPKLLEIKIIEKIGRKYRYFNVADRSKGFLWFFNFVMKLEFNPKISGSKKDTIFLLDEPGSYLHSTAQEKLCNKIKTISEKEGNVIYCTHSHHLLNPDYIPLNKIYIVEKDKTKNIKAIPLPKAGFKRENISAYQPIMDALQIPAFDLYNNSTPIIAVEGIYDKYSILLFCDLPEKCNVLPGMSANSIVKNLQYLNGFSKLYIAIWDNDTEGVDHYNKAVKLFGEHESEKFDKLPLLNDRAKMRMEDMYFSDLNKMAGTLNLPDNSNYEKILSSIFFASEEVKRRIKSTLSEETKNAFIVLSKIIKKRIEKARIIDGH